MGLAALALGDDLAMTEREAISVAQPLSRMLAQHTPLQRVIRKLTDPLILTGNLGRILKTRAAIMQARATTKALAIARTSSISQQRPPPPEPPPPSQQKQTTPAPPNEAPIIVQPVSPTEAAAILASVTADLARIP